MVLSLGALELMGKPQPFLRSLLLSPQRCQSSFLVLCFIVHIQCEWLVHPPVGLGGTLRAYAHPLILPGLYSDPCYLGYTWDQWHFQTVSPLCRELPLQEAA